MTTDWRRGRDATETVSAMEEVKTKTEASRSVLPADRKGRRGRGVGGCGRVWEARLKMPRSVWEIFKY